MKKIILSIMTSVSLFANIVIKPQSVNEITKPEYKLSLTGTLQQGNTEKESIGSGIKIVFGDGETYKHLFIGSYNYGISNNIEDTNKGLFHYRFTEVIKNNYDYEFFTQEEFNKFQNTKIRFLIGGNIRKRLLIAQRLFIGTGVMYSKVSPEDDSLTDVEKNKIKLNLYMFFTHKFNKFLSFNSLAFYQPTLYNLETDETFKFKDFRFNTKNSIISKITEKLSFTTNLDYSYHSKPFEDIKKDDLKLTVGLELKF